MSKRNKKKRRGKEKGVQGAFGNRATRKQRDKERREKFHQTVQEMRDMLSDDEPEESAAGASDFSDRASGPGPILSGRVKYQKEEDECSKIDQIVTSVAGVSSNSNVSSEARKKVQTKSCPEEDEERFLAPSELARRWSCSRATVSRIAKREGFRAIRLGRRSNSGIRYKAADIVSFEKNMAELEKQY